MLYNNNEYDYNVTDDLSDSDICVCLLAYIPELLENSDKTSYSIAELEQAFGECEFSATSDDIYGDNYLYRFRYNGYRMAINSYRELGYDEEDIEYIYVFGDVTVENNGTEA